MRYFCGPYAFNTMFFPMMQLPIVGHGLLVIEVSRSHHTWWNSSGRVISSSQRPLPDNTQQSQETDIPASDGIQTRKPSKRTVADPRLRPPGRWAVHHVNTVSGFYSYHLLS
jgi:hypothetical protein